MDEAAKTNAGAGTEEFFVAGGTLRTTVPSYIEREADHQLFEALTRSQFCYVLDTRQMGKSSLMARVARRLRRERNIEVVILDLTSFGQNVTFEQWYEAHLSYLGRQLKLEDAIEDFVEAHPGLGAVDRWVRVLREVVLPRKQSPLVVFVDEIDYVRSLPFPTDEFFAAIRQFYNLRPSDPDLERLSFCLLGVSTPNDLIRSEEITPFNLGLKIEIRDFSRKDAQILASGFQTDPKTAEKTLDRILYWTDGHPYLTQRLCSEVVRSDRAIGPSEVDRVCENLFLSPGGRDQNDNLRFVARRVLAPGVDPGGILDLYSKILRGKTLLDDGHNPLAEVLRLGGLAKSVNGRFRVRNEIYRRVFDQGWITENMPGQELRRLQAAKRRAYFRSLLVFGAIVLVIAVIFISVAYWRLLDSNATQKDLVARLTYAGDVAEKALSEAKTNLTLARANEAAATAARLGAEAAEKSATNARAQAEANMALAKSNEASATAARMRAEEATDKAASAQEDARKEAADNQRQNTSRRLALQAASHLDDELDLALLLAVESVKMDENRDSRDVLDKALSQAASLRGILHGTSHDITIHAGVSPDSRIFASSGDNGIDLWDLRTLTRSQHIDTAQHIYSVGFSPDGRWLAATGDDDFFLWSVDNTGQTTAVKLPEKTPGLALAFSPRSDIVAVSGGPDSKEPNVVSLWNVARKEVTKFKVTNSESDPKVVSNLTFSPDGKRLAIVATTAEPGAGTSVGNTLVWLWDVASRQKIQEWNFPDSIVGLGLAFGPRGETLALGVTQVTKRSSNTKGLRELQPVGKVFIWKTSDQDLKDEMTLLSTSPLVFALAFSPDGAVLASAGGEDGDKRPGTVTLWDSEGTVIQTMKSSVSFGNVIFTPDGHDLISTNENGKVMIWRTDDSDVRKDESPSQRACRIANRKLTQEEWHEAFGPEVTYKDACSGTLTGSAPNLKAPAR